GQNAVAVDIGIDDGGNACAFKLLRKFDHAQLRRFRPALDSYIAALGINADGNLTRKRLARLDHQRRIAHGNRAEDDTAQSLGKPVLDMLEAADATTELHRVFGGFQDRFHGLAIDAFASKGTVEINHMQPFKTLILKGP